MNREQDWIDRAIARDGSWEPPAHFVDRLAVQAFAALPPHRQQSAMPSGIVMRLRTLVAGVENGAALRIKGSLWVLRQYRELLLH